MKNLKSLLLAAVAALTLGATAASAEGQSFVGIGAGSVDMAEQSGLEYDLVLGGRYFFSEDALSDGIMLGLKTTIGMADLDNVTDKIYVLDADLEAGYRYKQVTVYGFGTIMSNSTDTYQAYGFGGGAGIEYQPWEHVAFTAEYKSVSMEDEAGVEYDYDVAKAYITYKY